MKKISLLICISLIICIFGGCAAKKQEFQTPVNFYYAKKDITYNSVSGVLQPEVREGAGFHGNLTACLRAYMLGPSSQDLQQLIPTDVYMVSCQEDEESVSVVMSNTFSQLSGVDLTTACSALLMTIHDYKGANVLHISVKDGLLDDMAVLTLSMDDIVLIDTVEE